MRKSPRAGFYLVRKYFIESLPECPIIALKKRKEKKNSSSSSNLCGITGVVLNP